MLIQILITIAVVAIEFSIVWALIATMNTYWLELGRHKIRWDNIIMIIVLSMIFATCMVGAWQIAEWIIN